MNFDEQVHTALYLAEEHGHCAVVQLLLEKGAEVNTQDRRHGNAL